MEIIWLDGTFGIGKTATANALVKKINNAYLLEFDDLQNKYDPTFFDFWGERYPEAKKYLIDALVNEIQKLIEENEYDYIIIPIALINDKCNEKLVNGFKSITCKHFILMASCEVICRRIKGQDNRDEDMALTYMSCAIRYLDTHYQDAIRIDTSDMTVEEVVEKLVENII